MIASVEQGTTQRIEEAVRSALQFVAEDFQARELDKIVSDYSDKLRAQLIRATTAMDVEVRRKMPSPMGMTLGVDVVFHVKDKEEGQ